jgi:hypothetical protein
MACDGHEARGLLVLLKKDEAFDRALATAYANRLRHGRSWSAFSIPTPVTPKQEGPALRALETDIGALFKAFDGSGRKLKIDPFERRGRNSLGGEGRVLHYTVYVEGLPETGIEFERGDLKRQVRHPVVEAAICCDPDGGHLDVVSKGGQPVRGEIAHAYARHILGSASGLESVQRRRFYLDRLKRPMSFATEPADGIKEVKVTLLRLADFGVGRLTLELEGSGDIHGASKQWFGAADPLFDASWRVTAAKLRIGFRPEAEGKKEKTITVELRAPNGSNLKDQTRRHELISEKYLEQWGLIERP